MPSVLNAAPRFLDAATQRTKASCCKRQLEPLEVAAVLGMISTLAICALALLCSVKVHGFDRNSAPVVNGIYPGRFVPDDLAVTAQAVISEGGISGDVLFVQEKPDDPVTIKVDLMGLDQYTDGYRWSIREYPVRTSLLRDFPCAADKLGGVFNPTNANASCNNTEDNMCPAGDLTTKLGPLLPSMSQQSFEDASISLTGSDSIVGRSLVIDREDGPEGAFICVNIEQLGVRRENLRATFDNSVIQGDVVIRYVVGRDDALIEADLYMLDGSSSTGNMWSLNSGIAGPNNSCNGLEAVYGSFSYSDALFTCNRNNQRECIIGDLTGKCGNLDFVDGRARSVCTDNQIGSIPRTDLFDGRHPEHALIVAIRDAGGMLLGCSPLTLAPPLQGRAQFRTLTIFGDFLFWQNGPDDRTNVRTYLTGLRGTDYSLRVFAEKVEMNEPCDPALLGSVTSRQGGEFILPGDTPTNDAGRIGNLDALLMLNAGQNSLRTTTTTSFLPLFGPHTILNCTLGLFNEETGVIEACAAIMNQEEYPPEELASLMGFQSDNNPPLPDIHKRS